MKNSFTIKLQASVLLAGELLIILSSAFWDDLDAARRWPAWLYIVLFAAGGYALAGSRRWLGVYLLFSATGVILGAVAASAAAVSTFSFAVAYCMLFQAVIRHCFFRARVAAADRILGGIAGYILLGFLWSSQCRWALMLDESAFVNTATGSAITESEQLYYSFVTLTGLGYGDIVPTTAAARLIVILNCLSGILYLAIFISGLMGGLAAKKQD